MILVSPDFFNTLIQQLSTSSNQFLLPTLLQVWIKKSEEIRDPDLLKPTALGLFSFIGSLDARIFPFYNEILRVYVRCVQERFYPQNYPPWEERVSYLI